MEKKITKVSHKAPALLITIVLIIALMLALTTTAYTADNDIEPNTIVVPVLEIVDNYRDDDRILVIFRTGDTGETAPSYILNTGELLEDDTYASNGKYPWQYDLDIRLNGNPLPSGLVANITWTVEGADGYPNSFANNLVSVADGSKVVTGLKSGIVKLTATLNNGASDSIYIVVPGDVSRDGLLNTRDAGIISDYIAAGNSFATTPDQFTTHLADISGDALINTRDSGIMLNMYAGITYPSN